jgi:hypothetical protein
MAMRTKNFWIGVGVGGGLFLALSYVLHCGFGMGPWGCQRLEQR